MRPLDAEELAALRDSERRDRDLDSVRPERLAAEERLVEAGLVLKLVTYEGRARVFDYRRVSHRVAVALRAHAAFLASIVQGVPA